MDPRESPKVCSLTQGLLQYQTMLYGFIYSLVRDVEAAEEVFQEVAVVAMEKERKGDEVIREPAKWLKEVVRRVVQAGYRTRSGRSIAVDPEYLELMAKGIAAEESSDVQQAKLSALGECLGRVSPPHRDLLRLRYGEGQSYERIGKEVKRSPGALRVMIHRLQKHLADCMTLRLAKEE